MAHKRKLWRITVSAGILYLLLGIFSQETTAQEIILNFNDGLLPSAKGWTFQGLDQFQQPLSESQVASVSGGILYLDTVPFGGIGSNGTLAYWRISTASIDSANYEYEIRMRAFAPNSSRSCFGGLLGAGIEVRESFDSDLTLMQPQLHLGGFTPTFSGSPCLLFSLDASIFHTYKLVVQNNIQATLFVDGIQIIQGLLTRPNNLSLEAVFGDLSTSGGNVTSEIEFIRVASLNRPPVAMCQNVIVLASTNCTVDASINNGSFDPDGDILTITQSPPGPYPIGDTLVTMTVTDSKGASSQCAATVTVNNPAPTVTINSPASGAVFAVGTPVNFAGSFTDNPGTHTATWMFDAHTQAGTVNEMTGAVGASYTFTTPGVYKVKLTVDDGCGGSGMATTVGGFDAMVVVYDPNGGFVTGGGWINSPADAYPANPSLTGKANFGFVSKYQPGATIPTGQTEFQFKIAGLNFQSASYDWLVVAGARAQYKGSGTINGGGNYGFILTAIDGQISGGGGADKFRIKIWDKGTGDIVYDNQIGADDGANPNTALGGGSIVIHK